MSDWLWSVEDMSLAMGAKLVGTAPDGIGGLSIDTRSISQGEAYFAIKGDVHDGHKFVANAYASGAVVSVISKEWVDRLEGDVGPLLVVPDVLKALEKLGCAARARTDAKIIAVTGSVGKTTTKEALRTALSPSGNVHAAVASFNNHWGVPLTLARMPEDTEFGIVEIGMNNPGEITPLVKMARPQVAIITNVAAVHLGAFKDTNEIARTKAEIFEGLEPGGSVILNGDDEHLPLLEARAKELKIENVLRFGEGNNAQSHLDKLVLHGTCSCLTATILDEAVVVKVGAPGRHMATNVLAVLAAVKLVGGDLAKAGLALADLQAVKGRGQQHRLSFPHERVILIDESYNANPTSMGAALALLASTKVKGRGRRIAVLGDMLELGSTSSKLHAELAEAVMDNNIDRVFVAGPEMKVLNKVLKGKVECTHEDDIEALMPLLMVEMRPGDVVMVKASLGMKFAHMVDGLLAKFPPQIN